jgi:predicted helicase
MLKEYIEEIQEIDVKNATEHTYRSPLQTLLEKINFPNLSKYIVHEGKDKNLDLEGTPDFFIYKDYATLFKTLVGFVECKKISYKLENLINSDQIKKYSKTAENIIITNYREFILLQKGKTTVQVNILDKNLQEVQNPNKEADFKNLLTTFYYYEYQHINNKKSLAETLANSSFYYSVSLRDFVNLKQEESPFYKKFNHLFKQVQTSLQIAYTLEDFCDIYSQSLVYGLLIARLEMGDEKFLEEASANYISFIPNDYKLLTEFLESGYNERTIPLQVKKSLVQVAKNLNFVNVSAIKEEFAKNNESINSIAVYLYEDFLKKYDDLRATERRKENGVYYTPKEVASFIVRATDDILKSSFQKKEGLLESGVKILDFACGTGTFLSSVLDFYLKDNNLDELEKHKIKTKIVADLYGFELLFTPYIVAHTILTKRLKDAGISLNSKEGLGIYLTNTLDITPHSISDSMPYLQEEHKKASQIKEETEVLAIIGNPPYRSGASASKAERIDGLITDTYKKDLNERKVNLDDLYIKFIKFAEHKIQNQKGGIVAIITNNSFLDGLTHRKMREHLTKTFDEIYILNLHGNTRRGEEDKNVFDIMVGVSINIFVKNAKPLKQKKVHYFSTLEEGLNSRKEKLQFLQENTIKSINWQELNLNEPNFWFVNKNNEGLEGYKNFISLADVFTKFGSGAKTDRDDLVIDYNKDLLGKKMEIAFSGNFDKEFSKKYNIQNSSSYKFADKLKEQNFDNSAIKNIFYRLFDNRFIYYKQGFTSRPAFEQMQHMLLGNIGLCFSRSFSNENYSNLFITKNIIDIHYNSDQSYLAPLYLYTEEGEDLMAEAPSKKPNFKKEFIDLIENLYNVKIVVNSNEISKEKRVKNITPEEVLHYIYAILHSPVYRSKYLEFLKIDFPKIPFTKSFEVFKKYSKLGEELTRLHTLESLPKTLEIKVIGILEEFKIKSVTHSLSDLHLETTTSKIIAFEGITKEIWEFEIGSYKPIEKWLKYRIKDEVVLGIDDLWHIKNMAISIKETILIMKELEEMGEEFLI